MSYQNVMDMPIRAFWSLNAQIMRLRSEEALDQMDLFLVANSNIDDKMIADLRKSHMKRMGDPADYERVLEVPLEEHTEGIEKLRTLMGG